MKTVDLMKKQWLKMRTKEVEGHELPKNEPKLRSKMCVDHILCTVHIQWKHVQCAFKVSNEQNSFESKVMIKNEK